MTVPLHAPSCFDLSIGAHHMRVIVYAWRLLAMTSKHRYEMNLSHDRLGTLHQRLADNEGTVARALSLIQSGGTSSARSFEARTRDTSTCVVCLTSTTSWIRCSRECHDVCLGCASTLCFGYKGASSALPCPSTEPCAGTFEDGAIARTEGGRRMLAERQHRKTVDMIASILSESPFDRASLKIRYLKSDGSFDALQCPMCGFGPIEHSHCNDLREFHQRLGIRNQCPRCDHFEECADKLVPWLGAD